MHKLTTLFFIILFTSFVTYAQDAAKSQGVNEVNTPISYQSDGTTLFMDDMNGDNTVAGIQARGWFFDDVDGAGTTTTFQGNATVFPAYEGPTDGYIGQNYNGAFGGGLLIDQWLISPQVTVEAGDTLKFWHRSPDGSTWPDPLQVWVSTTGGTTSGAFDVQLDAFNGSTAGWMQYVGNFTTSGTVRFAVRYYTTNGGPGGSQSDYIGLDLFEVISGGGGGGGFTIAADDFDSYTAGTGVAQQNGLLWQTWSNVPGGPEDPLVSSAQSSTSPNSLVIMPSNDIFTLLGTLSNPTTYIIEFNLYIPTGKAGYFNTLAVSPAGGTTIWAMQASLNVGGTGSIDAGGAASAIFNYPYDTWFPVRIDADLASDQATLWINNVLVHTWTYTTGTFGTPGSAPLQIQANNFYGATANDQMYVDDYRVSDVIPVELTSFTANVNPSGNVVLNWSTATEVNNQMFEIERRVEGSDFYRIGYVEGFGTTSEPQEYSYIDNSVTTGTYYYRLKQIDFNGTFEYFNEVMVDVQGPLGYNLVQNYPNPFNPSTRIDFNIAEPTMVRLAVYNLLGEEVQVLRNEFMQPGFYNVNFDASNLPSGMYIYKLETASYTQARKMMLMK